MIITTKPKLIEFSKKILSAIADILLTSSAANDDMVSKYGTIKSILEFKYVPNSLDEDIWANELYFHLHEVNENFLNAASVNIEIPPLSLNYGTYSFVMIVGDGDDIVTVTHH